MNKKLRKTWEILESQLKDASVQIARISPRHALLLFAFFSTSSWACSCDFYFGNIEEDFQNAAMVFRAKVIAVDHIPYMTTRSSGKHERATLIRAEVRVVSTFKGDTSDLIYVATDSSSCGASIIEGDDYVFFTSDIARVHLCGGSLAARNASAYSVDWADYVDAVSNLGGRRWPVWDRWPSVAIVYAARRGKTFETPVRKQMS